MGVFSRLPQHEASLPTARVDIQRAAGHSMRRTTPSVRSPWQALRPARKPLEIVPTLLPTHGVWRLS